MDATEFGAICQQNRLLLDILKVVGGFEDYLKTGICYLLIISLSWFSIVLHRASCSCQSSVTTWSIDVDHVELSNTIPCFKTRRNTSNKKRATCFVKLLQNELKGMLCVLPPKFKPVSQHIKVATSCVSTDIWLDKITLESSHTKDLHHLLQNKYRVCCKT